MIYYFFIIIGVFKQVNLYQLCYSFTSLIYHFDNSSKMNNFLMRHYSFCSYLSLLNINIIHHCGFTFLTILIQLFIYFLFAAFSACHRISTDVNKYKIYLFSRKGNGGGCLCINLQECIFFSFSENI